MIRRPPRSTPFPTRRSSDLLAVDSVRTRTDSTGTSALLYLSSLGGLPMPVDLRLTRSEEHTSELQSRLHLVCRLLLEKKKRSRSRGTAPRRTCRDASKLTAA